MNVKQLSNIRAKLKLAFIFALIGTGIQLVATLSFNTYAIITAIIAVVVFVAMKFVDKKIEDAPEE